MRRRLLLSTAFFGTVAAALWALAWATTFRNFDSGHGLTLEACGAGVATLLAWHSWREMANRDRAMLYLIDRACASRRAAQTEEVPLRAARAR